MTSVSTRFLGQPRLTKPTLAGAVGPEVADMLFFKGTRKMISGKQIYPILASNFAISGYCGTPERGTKGDTVSFPPIRAAVLILWDKITSPNAPEARCRLNGSQCWLCQFWF